MGQLPGPGIPPPEPPSEEGPDAEGAVTQEAVPEEKAREEPVAVARDWRLGKKPTPTIGSIPQPTVDQKKGAAADLEARIGGTWLLRIGLVSLAIALALFASSVVPDLSPGAKVALAYAGALAFFGIGKFFAARLEKFARPVMAGGLAFGFFVAFAAHFVPAMQAVSLPVSIVWMVVSMITVLIAAERWQSQPTAGLAILLGQISAFVSAGDAGAYSLVMIGLLALTAVILLLRHRWVALGVFAVAASYGSHLLWIFAERDPIPGDQGFWINFAFLTSYYVVFLIADVLWWRRNHQHQGETLTPAQVRSARQLGPTNLVLYVAVTTFVFVVTGAGIETIEWFFLTLGVVQGGLAWFYWDVNHRDFVYYPAFGTVLWTLGLFAMFDALALNLVLSSQALLMLIAAHRTRLWIFHALAQAAMFVAFIHYLVYPSPSPVTLAFFLGGLGVASVYLLKASLEEIWYTEGSPSEWFGGEGTDDVDKGLAGAFTSFFAPLASKLAPLHGVLGGFVVVREAAQYLDPGTSMALFLSTVALLMVATALVRGRVALLYAVTVIAASVLYFAQVITGGLATLLLLGGLATSALILVHFMADRFSDSAARQAAWQAHLVVAFVLMGGLTALFSAVVEFPGDLAWLVLPVLLLAFLERAGVAVRPMMAGAPREAQETYRTVTTAMYLLVSALVIALTAQAVGAVIAAPIWVAGWATLILVAAGLRKSRDLFIAGYAVLLAGYYYFLVVQPGGADLFSFLWVGLFVPSDLTGAVLSAWWAGLIVTVVPLALAFEIDRQIHARDNQGLAVREIPNAPLRTGCRGRCSSPTRVLPDAGRRGPRSGRFVVALGTPRRRDVRAGAYGAEVGDGRARPPPQASRPVGPRGYRYGHRNGGDLRIIPLWRGMGHSGMVDIRGADDGRRFRIQVLQPAPCCAHRVGHMCVPRFPRGYARARRYSADRGLLHSGPEPGGGRLALHPLLGGIEELVMTPRALLRPRRPPGASR